MTKHIERQIISEVPHIAMVVFDDLPILEKRSCRMFSDWIEKTAGSGIDIVVTMKPSNDCFGDYRSEKLVIGGKDFIASQRWDKKRYTDVLYHYFSDNGQSEEAELAALMILMRRGIVDNIRSLGYAIPENRHVRLRSSCPVIDVDEATGFFDASSLPVRELSDQLLECLVAAPKSEEGRPGRAGDRKAVEIERCFERLTQMSTHLFERGDTEQSRLLLELAGRLLTHDDAGFPLRDDAALGEGGGVSGFAPDAEDPLVSDFDYREQVADHEAYGLFAVNDGRALPGFGFSLPVASQGAKSEVSPVVVRLFGDFEVYRGGLRIEDKDLHRRKVRVLLSHLALNMGRGISRDLLLKRIWPEKDYLHAKDNFYSTWSRLSRILCGSGRSCPYLSNNRGLCKLEGAVVRSDVDEFEQLARSILFQKGSVEMRIEAVYRAEQLYRGDILSGSCTDEHIRIAEQRFRSLLVDVMLEASRLFSTQGNENNAVWFARKAYDADPGREDVYQVLMAVQDRAGQRTSALQTYFDCKRYLNEELGIMPSQKTIELYQSLIMDRQ